MESLVHLVGRWVGNQDQQYISEGNVQGQEQNMGLRDTKLETCERSGIVGAGQCSLDIDQGCRYLLCLQVYCFAK